jgi:hypothetical protein
VLLRLRRNLGRRWAGRRKDGTGALRACGLKEKPREGIIATDLRKMGFAVLQVGRLLLRANALWIAHQIRSNRGRGNVHTRVADVPGDRRQLCLENLVEIDLFVVYKIYSPRRGRRFPVGQRVGRREAPERLDSDSACSVGQIQRTEEYLDVADAESEVDVFDLEFGASSMAHELDGFLKREL